jgi:hypothetical protein
MREAGETRHNLIYQINVYEQFEVLRTITANNVHITALARRLVKEAAAFVEGKLKAKQQCSGSGSTGSTCFWASQIRIRIH